MIVHIITVSLLVAIAIISFISYQSIKKYHKAVSAMTEILDFKLSAMIDVIHFVSDAQFVDILKIRQDLVIYQQRMVNADKYEDAQKSQILIDRIDELVQDYQLLYESDDDEYDEEEDN